MSKENVEAVRVGYEALNRNDVAGLLAVIHPEVEFTPLIGNLDGRIYRGHQGMAEYAATIHAEWEQIDWTIERLVDAGDDRVIGVVRMHGRGREGIEVAQQISAVFTFRDGKAFHIRTFPGGADAFAAAGLTA